VTFLSAGLARVLYLDKAPVVSAINQTPLFQPGRSVLVDSTIIQILHNQGTSMISEVKGKTNISCAPGHQGFFSWLGVRSICFPAMEKLKYL
jgi:hypothetical protein